MVIFGVEKAKCGIRDWCAAKCCGLKSALLGDGCSRSGGCGRSAAFFAKASNPEAEPEVRSPAPPKLESPSPPFSAPPPRNL